MNGSTATFKLRLDDDLVVRFVIEYSNSTELFDKLSVKLSDFGCSIDRISWMDSDEDWIYILNESDLQHAVESSGKVVVLKPVEAQTNPVEPDDDADSRCSSTISDSDSCIFSSESSGYLSPSHDSIHLASSPAQGSLYSVQSDDEDEPSSESSSVYSGRRRVESRHIQTIRDRSRSPHSSFSSSPSNISVSTDCYCQWSVQHAYSSSNRLVFYRTNTCHMHI